MEEAPPGEESSGISSVRPLESLRKAVCREVPCCEVLCREVLCREVLCREVLCPGPRRGCLVGEAMPGGGLNVVRPPLGSIAKAGYRYLRPLRWGCHLPWLANMRCGFAGGTLRKIEMCVDGVGGCPGRSSLYIQKTTSSVFTMSNDRVNKPVTVVHWTFPKLSTSIRPEAAVLNKKRTAPFVCLS